MSTGIERIAAAFAGSGKRAALMPYLMGGFPDLETSVRIGEAHSVSAGLDYPGSGPEHAHLRESGRARYEAVTAADALAAFRWLAATAGIIPALASSPAIAWLRAKPAGDAGVDLVCLSGRGDQDLAEVRAHGEGPQSATSGPA